LRNVVARPDAATIAAAAVIVAVCALRAVLAFTQPLDPDELEHLHGAWSISQGQWPYRDYFEHHTPWLHLAFAPLFALFAVDRDADDAVTFLFLARAVMWVLGTVAIALTGRLAGRWEGARTGWTAAALLAVTIPFVGKTAEVRPDTPAIVCLLGSWIACLRALGTEPATGARRLLAGSGILLGAAVMFTQKALFTFPATGLLLLWWILEGRRSGATRVRLAGAAVFASAVLLPIALTLGLFAFHGGVRGFIESNFLLNAAWPVRLSPVPMMERIHRLNPALVWLAAAGLVRGVVRLFVPGALARGDALVVLYTIGLLAGAFVIPIPLLQYFVMLLPLAAVLAGSAFVCGMGAVTRTVARANPRLAAAVTAPLLALGLIALVAPPSLSLARGLDPARPRLQDQLGRIRFVLGQTTAEETVMDGFTGAGVFRPHAWFYFFLHDEIRALLGAPQIGRLRAQLREGEIAPALVVFDDELQQMHREITSFLRDNYEPTGDPLVWRRKDLALDGERWGGRLELGEGPTDVLVGRGWAAAQADGGRRLRLTQGRRSTLRVPLRAPADTRVVVRARTDSPAAGAIVGLIVNDVPAGERPLISGWADYAFDVPARAWRRGVNRVRLTRVPGEGRGAAGEAGDAGRVPGIAVDYVQLTPLGPSPAPARPSPSY
jgi:4-amino-4-deoxy-L-arabinose transferase-like glycosyltransferase